MPRPARLLAAAAVAVLSLAAAACSSGGGAKPTSTAVPVPTRTPLPAPLATAVAQRGRVPLVPYTDPGKRFTVKMPEGWTIEPTADGVNAFVPSATSPVAASLGILCAPGLTVAALVKEDQTIGARIGSGAADLAQATPVAVAGAPAQLVPWSGKLGSVLIEHATVYFAGKGCAWRIQLNTFPGSNISQFRPVLNGVLASFAFT